MPEQLDNVVVVLPGIMGSVLRDAHGDDVWELSAGSILKGVFGRLRGLKALQLPEGIGDDHPGDGVTAPALMPDMHVVPGIWTVTIGYDRLHKWFTDTFDIVEFDPNGPATRAERRELPAVPVRLAPLEPVQRAATPEDRRTHPRTVPQRNPATPTRSWCSSGTRWAVSSRATTPMCSAGTRSRPR